jgi:hypothetical protein
LRAIWLKNENQPLFLQNFTGSPEIVIVSPITRCDKSSRDKWSAVLEMLGEPEITTLIVIDKTEEGQATDYFMSRPEFTNKRLFVLPRSIRDTLFDSLGEIILDKDMWIIQLHDDDNWKGKICLPIMANSNTVYYSDFYLLSNSSGLTKFKDFSLPNRIVFSLVPSVLWNRFSKMIRDQSYHVPGSFDFTYNLMARLSCKFDFLDGFIYEWNNANWKSTKHSKSHLIGLAQRDGWANWSSPEIANFNRSVDSLVALNYILDFIGKENLHQEIHQLIGNFRPSNRKRLKFFLLTPILLLLMSIQKGFFYVLGKDLSQSYFQDKVRLHRFILKTWRISNVLDLSTLINELIDMNKFELLLFRFKFWKQALNDLEMVTTSDK